MAFRKSDYTIKRHHDYDLGNNKLDLKVNSYKDNTIEVTMVDKRNGVNIDIPLGDHKEITYGGLYQNITPYVNAYVRNTTNKDISKKEVSGIINDLRSVISIAIPFKGEPTLDYSGNDCQSMLTIRKAKKDAIP